MVDYHTFKAQRYAIYECYRFKAYEDQAWYGVSVVAKAWQNFFLPAIKKRFSQEASAQSSPENLSCLKERVMELVKKFDKIDSNKVTEAADFQKDLCLDSLDRVELVMAFEQEFSIEIPDEKADKINSCADAIRYIASQPKYNTQGSS